MKEFDLQRVYNYPIYPRGSKINSDKGFDNIGNGSMGGTHWTFFIKKDEKSCYYDPFEGNPDNIPPNQLPKPIICHSYKIQDINSRFCG